jgi:hypothetical protein
MKTFLIALALIFAVICGAVVVSGLTGSPMRVSAAAAAAATPIS